MIYDSNSDNSLNSLYKVLQFYFRLKVDDLIKVNNILVIYLSINRCMLNFKKETY